MSRLTQTGLVIDRYEDIDAALSTQLQNLFRNNLDLSDDSLAGIYQTILSFTEAEIWELFQAVYDSANLAAAEGVLLDNLCLLVGIVRQPATRTRGVAWLTADDGEVVVVGDKVYNVLGDEFVTVESVNITPTACVAVDVGFDYFVPNTDYTLELNGNVYRNQAATEEELLQLFLDDLALDGEVNVFLKDGLLAVRSVDESTFSLAGTTYFQFLNVTVPVICAAVNTGAIPANTGTIVRFEKADGSPSTVSSVTNPQPFVIGSDTEDDVSLRARLIDSYNRVGGSSPDTITDALLGVQGVTSVKVVENVTDTLNSRGLPPKSYQVIVQGGDDLLIAETMWKHKPAGVLPYADPFSSRTTKVEFYDYNDQLQKIRFVRPQVKYIWLHVEYTRYAEEDFTPDGENIMKQVLANYGQTLGIGNDVVPKRFYPYVYKNVKGVDDLNIYFAVTDDLNTPPTYPADYSLNRIQISDEQVTNFAAGRVEVSQI